MRNYKSLLENLEITDKPVRRYSLSDMISESYKTMFQCEAGTNLYKLAEAHLMDVKQNPMDSDRLSAQLGAIKDLLALKESNSPEFDDRKLIKSKSLRESEKIDGEDLVPEKSQDSVEPKEDRALDLQESSEEIEEAKRTYAVFPKKSGQSYAPIRVKARDEKDAISQAQKKNRKYRDYDWEAELIESEEKDLSESASSMNRTWGDWQVERGNSSRVKFYCSGMDLTNQIIGVVYEESGDHPYYGAEIYDNSTASTIEDRADDSYHFDTEKEAMEWVEEWFSKDIEECDDPKKTSLEEADEPELTDEELEELTKHLETIRKERKAAASQPKAPITEVEDPTPDMQDMIMTRLADILETEFGVDPNSLGELLDNLVYHIAKLMTTKKPVEESSEARKGIKVHCAKMKESKKEDEWARVKEGLSNFSKASSSKAFYKTFKKMHEKLKEGTALTRQETINLYKAANSAMTHFSVELEHNPDFLAIFKECTSLLSKDVESVLGSLKEGKAPSKKTMKSLAKFSEALLYEDEEEEELPPIEDEENEFISDEEGEIVSEEEEEFDQEYADARVELHKELVDEHGDTEDPGVQEKLVQDAEEVVDLPGITDEQVAEITGEEIGGEGSEDTPEEEPASEETPEEEPTEEEIPEEEPVDDDDITDDELAELKRHLTEMRKAKRAQK